MNDATFTARVLDEMEGVLARLLERHHATAREWFPHQLIPWSRGRDLDGWDAVDASHDAGRTALPVGVQSALIVNLLTEDNLPFYFEVLQRHSSSSAAWGEWARRWTAEEARHAMVIRDYLHVTRAVDPVALERDRMEHMSRGFSREFRTPLDGAVYATIQELATRVSHHNVARAVGDDVGERLLLRVAADENLHYLLYRDLCSAMLERWPSEFVRSLEAEVRDFRMPGAGIRGFQAHARAIAGARIYDLQTFHDQVVFPLVHRHWRIPQMGGLDGDAEGARERLMGRLERLRDLGTRLRESASPHAGLLRQGRDGRTETVSRTDA